MPARSATTRWHRRGLLAGIVSLLVVMVIGCSPERRYKVLSFFFDGVPDPNAPRDVKGVIQVKGPGGKTHVIYVHKPVSDGNCKICHGTDPSETMSVQPVAQDVCMKCHEPLLRQHPRMHGPVVHKLCRWCHEAHESDQPHLLRGAPAKVCGQCHDPAMLGDNPPEHADRAADCTSCHSGHGGTQRFFLTLSAGAGPTTMPSTQPATTRPDGEQDGQTGEGGVSG